MEKKKGLIAEFKEFIQRGNVMELAVGVVLGSAFSAIVTSVVNDLIMPIVGMIIGGIDFTSLSVSVGTATLTYGNFIQNVVNFLIIAFCVFIAVKMVNKLLRKNRKEEKTPEAPTKSDEVILLEEIRDLLKKRK